VGLSRGPFWLLGSQSLQARYTTFGALRGSNPPTFDLRGRDMNRWSDARDVDPCALECLPIGH